MALKDLFSNGRNDVINPGDVYIDDDYVTEENFMETGTSGVSAGDTGATIEMKVVKPTCYKIDEAKQYGDLLLDRKTVLLNLESTSLEDARRLLDFLSGVVHAVDGKIEKVGKKTFVATPHNVDVTGPIDIADEETEEAF